MLTCLPSHTCLAYENRRGASESPKGSSPWCGCGGARDSGVPVLLLLPRAQYLLEKGDGVGTAFSTTSS